MSVEVDIKALLASGAHFGHKTSRWHPKMAPFIHSKKGSTHIIDLTKTVSALEDSLAFLEETSAKGKQVLFVGTKPHLQQVVIDAATAASQPYVTMRWLGGMLTNKETMSARIKHLKKLEERMESGELESRYNKLELQRFQEEIDAMNNLFGGIKNMNGTPGAIVVTDAVSETVAIKEARRLKVPIVAIVDTNADPSDIDYPIPCNDDAIMALKLVLGYMVQAINDGRGKVKAPADAKDKEVAVEEESTPKQAKE